MDTVSARPSALRHYAATFRLEDARLREDAQRLEAVLERYQASSEVAAGSAGPAAGVRALGEQGLELARRVDRTAIAFERLDADAPAHAGDGSARIHHGDASSLMTLYGRLASAWDDVDHLGDLIVPLGDEHWAELLWPRSCPPLQGGRYTGGGGVVGPDGRVYPLVIPELDIGEQTANFTYEPLPELDPATLGGQDPGWVEVDRRAGLARVIDYEAGVLARTATALAVATGLSPPRHQWASPDVLARVALTEEGRPHIDELPPRLVRDPRVGPVDGPSDPTGRNSRRSGAFDLVTGAVEGAALASRLNDPGVNVYRTVFEEHEDGGRRARMLTHQLKTTEHGSGFVTMMGYGVDGQLRRKPATEATSDSQRMSAAPGQKGGRSRQNTIGPRDPATSPRS